MNKLMLKYKEETGKDPLSHFSPSLEYVEWLENKINAVARKCISSKVNGNSELNYILDRIIMMSAGVEDE